MRRLPFVGAFVIATIISILVAYSQHIYASSRCSLDGSRIEPLYEVIITQKDGSCSKFSCVPSVQIWLRENSEQVSSIAVTDEISGKKIEAKDAFYVESEVITTPHTGNRIHVFAQKAAAKLHARQFNGKLVKNPLRTHQKKSVKLVTYRPDLPNSTYFISSSFQKPLCLASNSVLLRRLDCSCTCEKGLNRLPKGYSSPPDKPPRHFF